MSRDTLCNDAVCGMKRPHRQGVSGCHFERQQTTPTPDEVRTRKMSELRELARELLAQAHEPRRYLIAVDIRTGNIGPQGVMWVETETALKAIEAALRAREEDRG